MRNLMQAMIATLIVACSTPAPPTPANDATDAESETCLRTKIWEMNRDGWSVRNFGSVRLASNTHQSFAVNLYTSRSYSLMACGVAEARDVELQLYSPSGERVIAVTDQGRQPSVTFTPKEAGQYFLVVRNRTASPTDGSMSWSVLYR